MTLKERIAYLHEWKALDRELPGASTLINLADLALKTTQQLQEIIELQTKALEFVNSSDSALCSSEEARKALKKTNELMNK